MRNLTFGMIAVAGSLLMAPTADAAFFDLRTTDAYPEGTIESLDENNSFSLTVDGITATLTANSGVLNQLASGFGVNNADSGDETNKLDGDNDIDDLITITFSEPVNFTELVLSGATAATDAGYDIADTTGTIDLVASGGVVATPFSILVPVSDDVLVFWEAGATGFGLDSFTVSAIPEPASLGLLVLGAGPMASRRKRA